MVKSRLLTGYQQKIPYTKMETADLWEINDWIRAREAERMSRQQYFLP